MLMCCCAAGGEYEELVIAQRKTRKPQRVRCSWGNVAESELLRTYYLGRYILRQFA